MRRSMSTRMAGVLIGLFGFVAALAAQDQAVPVTERVIDRNFIVRGMGPCTVGVLALTLGRIVAAPTGVEFLPGRCSESEDTSRWLAEPISLIGMTAGEALDRLVALDPRYAWKDAGGVLVVRPMAAWGDRQHFLHRRMETFEIVDQHLGAALELVGNAVWGEEGSSLRDWGMRTPQGVHRFTVRLGPVQIVDALNAAARAHGHLQWRISYCLPYARTENAFLKLNTFDEDGLGERRGFPHDAGGKPYDPCGGRL